MIALLIGMLLIPFVLGYILRKESKTLDTNAYRWMRRGMIGLQSLYCLQIGLLVYRECAFAYPNISQYWFFFPSLAVAALLGYVYYRMLLPLYKS